MTKSARSGGQGREPPDGSEPPSPGEDDGGAIERPEPGEVAEYVASMAAELAAMARGSKLDFVAHLLDMARLAAVEAGEQARHPPTAERHG